MGGGTYDMVINPEVESITTQMVSSPQEISDMVHDTNIKLKDRNGETIGCKSDIGVLLQYTFLTLRMQVCYQPMFRKIMAHY